MKRITAASECTQSELLAWVQYPYNGHSCYVYPRYIRLQSGWASVDPEAFPNNGCFQATIQGDSDPQELKEQFGDVVVAVVNADDFTYNNYYEREKPISSEYFLRINTTFMQGHSDLELTALSDHALSKELVQIVALQDSVSFARPLDRPVFVDADPRELFCQTILVERESAGELMYMGPFTYDSNSDGTVSLSALQSNDYRVARFNSTDLGELFEVREREGRIVGSFCNRDKVEKALRSADSGRVADWLPDKVLIDAFGKAIQMSDEFSDLSNKKKRNLKAVLQNCTEEVARIRIDSEREERLERLLSDVNLLLGMPTAVVDAVVGGITPDQLADVVLNEKYYPKFREKILESSDVRKEIDEERRNLESSIIGLREEEKEARIAVQRSKDEAAVAKSAAEEAKMQVDQLREDALKHRRGELDALNSEIEEQRIARDQVKREYEQAVIDRKQIQDEIDAIFDGLDDSIATSGKIMESEILRKVVASVSGAKLASNEEPRALAYSDIFEGEDDLTDGEVADSLVNAVVDDAGRDYSKNDVINFIICLIQGYITTFAGMPGTGKTSLCNILAGALGLMNDSCDSRFTEVSVESGWTSYKDYIGYYNPLAKTFEKSNPIVFDAMQSLTREAGNCEAQPPYILLLDEANLSPIEHYWSPFLRACDTFNTEGTPLTIGGGRTWRLPPNVRFLATVNFDHTTEVLSQRFLDRSWVITLDPDQAIIDTEFAYLNSKGDSPRRLFTAQPAFSYRRLLKAFGKGDSNIDQKILEFLNELLRICRECSMPVSPRSHSMLLRYISAASKLMETDSKSDQYAPLDYAFSQKVLPMISGPEESVGGLIDKLLDRCSQLPITEKRLKRMKTLGEDNGFYQYFA